MLARTQLSAVLSPSSLVHLHSTAKAEEGTEVNEKEVEETIQSLLTQQAANLQGLLLQQYELPGDVTITFVPRNRINSKAELEAASLFYFKILPAKIAR